MDKKIYEYEVALSFASEQRDYVQEVSHHLSKLGIQHFYDKNEMVELWGTYLISKLDSIYFEKSKYFVPFISKEYKQKKWTKLESNIAIDRNMETISSDIEPYILPVIFDETRIPGISNNIGYISAREYSPKQIANFLYEKVKGVKPLKEVTPSIDTVEIPSIEYYSSKINENRLTMINEFYQNNHSSLILVVHGEKGLGKKSCISKFLSDKKNVVKITWNYENQYQLEPIVRSLNLNIPSERLNIDLNFKEIIKKEVLSYFQRNHPIIYVEKLNEFDDINSKFLMEITDLVLKNPKYFNTVIIFEFDTDEDIDLIRTFDKFPAAYTNFICFEKLSNQELEQYLELSLGKINISKSDLEYILSSCSGNIMYLNVIINYLRRKQIIYYDGNGLTCKKLSKGIFHEALKEFIIQRYDRLDTTLKEIISKSAVIGNIFCSDLLSQPFNIINADDMLKKIEGISKLIIQPDEENFTFESLEVYTFIKDNIPYEQQQEWHRILGTYYEKLLDKEKKYKSRFPINREIELMYTIGNHYEHAKVYSKAIKYKLELINLYKTIGDCQHILNAINSIRNILKINWEEDSEDLEYSLLLAEADCYKEMSRFKNAIELYNDCIEIINNKEIVEIPFDILYEKSYCLYMDGQIEETLDILHSLKEKFENESKLEINYIKTISFLASVYDITGQIEEQKILFIQSLNFYRENHYEKEYYISLKISSMVFGEELALPMYEEAEKYFEKNNFIRYLAEVLHNKATDLIYLNQLDKIKDPIEKSIELFNSFGSHAVHYPLNTSGILEMVLKEDFEKALEIFNSALKYDMEFFSEITLRTNILNCLNKLGRQNEAYEQLNLIDTLIAEPSCELTLVYKIYHHLNWAFYYFNFGDYKNCLSMLEACGKLNYMESRYAYVYKFLKYQTKKLQEIPTRNTAGTSPNKIFEYCVKNGFYFTTLRFYESL